MTGQKSLIALRSNGLKPSAVFLFALAKPLRYSRYMHPENQIPLGCLPEIHIGPDEIAGTLDLRCITGLTVLLQGETTERVMEVYDRLLEFQPSRVAGIAHDRVALLCWHPKKGFYEHDLEAA